MSEKCVRCRASGDDRRTLYMSCLYDMMELGIPFKIDDEEFFTLQVCKDCRAEWMMTIRAWFDAVPGVALAEAARKHVQPGMISLDEGIPVRVLGATVVVPMEHE